MYDAIREAFFKYVELDFPIIPLCPHKHQRMGASHRDKCKYPGKVPLLLNWTAHKETTKELGEQWFESNPFINLGLPMGQASGIVGIDIDGTYGEKKLQEFSNGDLPETWEFTTNGGRRLLYKVPPGVKTKKVKDFNKEEEHAEMAILCDGQQTVLPPSIHASGYVYKWTEQKSPWDIDIAEAPKWLLQLCTVIYDDTAEIPPPTLQQTDWQEPVVEGGRNNHLAKLAGSLLSRRNIPKEQVVLFVDAWNREHCRPPIELVEIERMVDSLAASESLKAAKRKAKQNHKKSFKATPIAQRFLQLQAAAGFSWEYAVEQGAFYYCDNLKGPWARVDNLLVQKTMRTLLIDTANGGDEDWDTSHYVTEAVNALRELIANASIGLFDIGRNAIEHQKIISVQNGILNWETLELTPWNPSIRTTLQLNTKWEEGATAETWETALSQWIPDEDSRKFLQEFIGLCLVPDTTYRTAVFLYGVGANGKSIFLEGIKMLFGEYALTSIPLHRIADRFEVANLQNKLINICGDIDAKYLNETGVLKALIGGDSLRGEYKNGKSFNFEPVARLMFSANNLPRVADKSAAWYSRWKFVHFPNQFPVSSSYKINILRKFEEEKAGILRWAIEGLRRLKISNNFTQGQAMTASELIYRTENDNVLAFALDIVSPVEHTGGTTTLSTVALYHVYKEWAEQNGYKLVGQIEFAKRMQINGYEKALRPIRGKTSSCFLGIQIHEEWQATYNFYEGVKPAR